MWLGTVALSADRLEPAEQALRQAVELADELAAAGPAEEELRMTVGIGYQYLADVLLRGSKGEQAESAIRRSLRAFESLAVDLPDNPAIRRELVQTCELLARIQLANGRTDEGRRSCQRLVEVLERAVAEKLDAEVMNQPWLMNDVAWLLVGRADYPRRWVDLAITLAKLNNEQSPNSAKYAGTLGTAYYRAGEWAPPSRR